LVGGDGKEKIGQWKDSVRLLLCSGYARAQCMWENFTAAQLSVDQLAWHNICSGIDVERVDTQLSQAYVNRSLTPAHCQTPTSRL